ncbi:MAG: ankyrin repeat domain-containing protein [Verrucomicrobiota bacterium]
MKIKWLLTGMLVATVTAVSAATNDLSGLLQKGLFEEEANRDLAAASAAYETLVKQLDKDRQIGATAIFRLGEVYRKQGKTNEAAAQYQRIVRDFAEQTTLVTLSRQNLAGLGAVSAKRAIAASETKSQSHEAQELERSEIIVAQLANWELPQLRKLIPALVPDAEFERLNEQMNLAEAMGNEPAAVKQREVLNLQLQKRAEEITAMLDRRVKILREEVAKQNVVTKAIQTATQIPVTTVVDEEETEIRRIQAMIQNSPDLINAAAGDPSRTPLGRAAEKGQLRVAEYLLNNGADVNTSASGSPLAIAARNGHKKMVELLLARGAAFNAVDSDRRTPLHVAVTRNYPAVVESLLAAKADLNARDNGDNTPLMAAVLQGSVPMAQALLARGADVNLVNKFLTTRSFPNSFPNVASDRFNYGSALHLAAGRGNVAMVQLLLTNRAAVAVRNIFGETALHVAAANGSTNVAALLIAAGADVNAAGAEDQTGGATPLHLAVTGGHRDMVKLLLEKGANPNIAAVVGSPGRTPLIQAAYGKDAELIALLLKAKADPNAMDAQGNFALLNAVLARNAETTRVLLTGGADPDMLNPNRYPLLMLAVTDAANKEVAQALIEAKANVNALDPNGRTPLHWAAAGNRTELVELLVKAGADVNLRDGNGKTALDLTKSGRSTYPSGTLSFSAPTGPGMAPHGQSASAKSTEPKPDDVATLLRKHGALDNLPAFDRIQITRPAVGVAKTIFTKGRIEVSSFTLLDVLGVQYLFLNEYTGAGLGKRDDARLLAMNDFRSDAFSFPDLTKVRLRRPSPDGKKWDERVVDVAALFRDGDCSQNLELKWGDEIVIPETDHGLGERWDGFSRAGLKTFNKCLTRTVEIVVKGQAAKVTIGPKFESLENNSMPCYVTTGASLWLRPVLYGSNLLLASSDLARVKVTRTEPAARKPREWVLDCSSDKSPEFWLRDGDVIEVPDKP